MVSSPTTCKATAAASLLSAVPAISTIRWSNVGLCGWPSIFRTGRRGKKIPTACRAMSHRLDQVRGPAADLNATLAVLQFAPPTTAGTSMFRAERLGLTLRRRLDDPTYQRLGSNGS